jgi:hypothetical protein
MTAVWELSKTKDHDLLVLLAIADNARDDGLAWPGRKLIARKARVDERTVTRSVKRLETLGEIAILSRGTGRSSTRYQVLLTLEAGHRDTPDTGTPLTPGPRRGDTGVHAGATRLRPRRGDTGDTRIIKEPSDKSSSSDETISRAFDVIADQRMASAKDIRTPRSYRATVLKGVRAEFLSQARTLISEQPDIHSRDLAALLESEPERVDAVDQVASAERWGAKQAMFCSTRNELDDALRAQCLAGPQRDAAVKGWEAASQSSSSARSRSVPA